MLGIYVNEMQRSINGAGLGDVPNDFESARDLCYLPVRQQWYYAYPPSPSSGLGLAAGNQNGDVALKSLAGTMKTQIVLQAIAAASIATLAILGIRRAVRGRE